MSVPRARLLGISLWSRMLLPGDGVSSRASEARGSVCSENWELPVQLQWIPMNSVAQNNTMYYLRLLGSGIKWGVGRPAGGSMGDHFLAFPASRISCTRKSVPPSSSKASIF